MKTEIIFTREPIDAGEQRLSSREIGAALEFYGIVRETEHDAAIPALDYEAYEPMARMQLERIIDQLNAEHPCESLRFIHRLGRVPVGEASLYIRVLAKHRGEAFQFTSKLIDRLKQDVPIWKSSAAR